MIANRLVIDDDTIERDLVKLVLTVVELVRQLMNARRCGGSTRATSPRTRRSASVGR